MPTTSPEITRLHPEPLVQIHAKVPPDLLDRADRMAAAAGASRSDLIRSALAAFVATAEQVPA